MFTRRHLLGAGALTATALITGCGRSAAPAGSTASAAAGAFPVTIAHKYGSTELTRAPTRVVCVGLTDQDALLALGVVPVATTNWFGDAPGRIFSWAEEELGDAPVPEVLSGTDGVPVEKVAALAPDLIIGQYAGVTEKDYALLSKIAPTVVQPGEHADYGVPWEQATLTVGTAIGRPEQAQALVDSVQQRLADEAKAHPEFAGKRAVVVTPYEGLFVYGPQDPRGRILASLGFTFPDELTDPTSTLFGWSLSAERAGDLADLDAVVWLSTPAELAKTFGKVWTASTAHREGRAVHINEADGDYYVAQSFVTPLSIPYVLDRYVPQLAAAVDGDAGTDPA